MALPKLTQDLNYHQALGNRPNLNDGLNPEQLKARYDQAVNDIKDYINDTLTLAIDTQDSANVKITGAQTIADVKTFSSSPIVPTPTTDMQASTKKYVDDTDTIRKSYIDTNFATKAENALKADTANIYTRSQLNAGQLNSLYFSKAEADVILANYNDIIASVGQGFDDVINYFNSGILPEGATDSVYAEDGTMVTATSGMVYI